MALTNEEFLASLIAATDAGDTPDEALEATRMTERLADQAARPSRASPERRASWQDKQRELREMVSAHGLRVSEEL